jgi:predicted GTPase
LGLESILDRPLANTALDLIENATTQRQKDILVRLRKSLVQYLERTGGLVYVALIGHFSSGKSSTINSLLDLWNSDHQRTVDLHPTDNAITLITHTTNAASLLGLAIQGSVPIRIQTVDANLLKEIVLADTPGTGDPQLMEEMARDFLPICDLVLFFFSATSPLDTTDLPLLKELHTKLPFIPLLFVITRADELRLDAQRPITSDNYDSSKASQFLAGVMSRITLLLKPQVSYNDSDFILIDNKAGYNIDTLKTNLVARADPSNVSARLSMHSHKVHFFLKTAETLQTFFSAFLDAKLTELNRIVMAAEKNIRKYQQGVIISNSDLTHSWFERHTLILELRSKITERTKNLDSLPSSLFDTNTVASSLMSMRTDISRQARWGAERLEHHVMHTGFVELHKELSRIQRELWEPNLNQLSPQNVKLLPVQITWTFGDYDFVSAQYLARRAEDHRETIRQFMDLRVSDVHRSLEELQRAIQGRQVINKSEEIVFAAQTNLENDLSQYFHNVEVYRAGVFAITNKASIQKLGIGEQLDKLEKEFTDEDKEAKTLAAKQNLFPSFADVVAAASTQLATISESIRACLRDMNAIRIEKSQSLEEQIEKQMRDELPNLLGEIGSELQRESEEFMGRAQTRLQGIAATVLQAYDDDVSRARRDHLNKYVMALVGVFTLLMILFIIFHWVVRPIGQSAGETVFWGVLVEVIGMGIGFWILKIRDKYPATQTQIKSIHIAKLRQDFATTVDELIEKHQFASLKPSAFGTKLERLYADVVVPPADEWQANIEENYKRLRAGVSTFQELRSKYLSVVETLTNECSRYFDDAQKNLEVLNSTAQAIRERAIEPSFELLERTSSDLTAVRDEINAIRFS